MVTIQIYSAGAWATARFGDLSPGYAAALVANLRERGTRARLVPAGWP